MIIIAIYLVANRVGSAKTPTPRRSVVRGVVRYTDTLHVVLVLVLDYYR